MEIAIFLAMLCSRVEFVLDLISDKIEFFYHCFYKCLAGHLIKTIFYTQSFRIYQASNIASSLENACIQL